MSLLLRLDFFVDLLVELTFGCIDSTGVALGSCEPFYTFASVCSSSSQWNGERNSDGHARRRLCLVDVAGVVAANTRAPLLCDDYDLSERASEEEEDDDGAEEA